MNDLEKIDNDGIKQAFRDADCQVTDFDDGYFEVVRQPFPAASLVRANPYFVEFNTILWARPIGFLGKRISNRNSVLNQLNQITKVAKITCNQHSIDPEDGCWRFQTIARFVTGRIESEHASETIDHWMNLWLQDVANLVREETAFEIIAMLKDQNGDD